MEILKLLNARAAEAGLSFLLAGGHAVTLYGAGRQTGDIDLIVRRDQKDGWKTILSGFGYTLFHEHENFLQYTPPDIGYWPVDLMLVKPETFAALHDAGQDVQLDGADCRIPSALHIIAMKLHALKENYQARELKDLADIIGLLSPAGLSAESEDFRRLCESYGTLELYEQIRKRAGN